MLIREEILSRNFVQNQSNKNGRFSFEKTSPLGKYPDFNVQPDFFLDQFYLGQGVFTDKEINFAGNHILVLNSFIPGNLEAFGLHYATDIGRSIAFNQTSLVIDPKVLLVLPTMAYDTQFKKLYRTNTTDTLTIANGGSWNFAENILLSTPILVLLTRDVRPIGSEVFREKYFRYNLKADIPNSSATATINCFHGYTDLVQVAIMINATASLTINIKQVDHFGDAFTDQIVTPGTFPYHEIFTLPRRVSKQTLVEVIGSGAGSPDIEIEFILSPE